MKTKILTTTLFLIMLTGCEKQPQQAVATQNSDNPTITAQFEKSDNRISKFLDRLDDPNTTQDVRMQILCKDYPEEYKTKYMPTLLALSPGEYTEGSLLKDLKIALDYYKSEFEIKCK